MSVKKKNSKIVKYRRFPLFNIGTVMFGILFVYMIVCLIMYLTSTHITAYEVTAGPLSGNYRYTALAVKSEKVVTASQSGSVSYYAREGTKVGKGNNVCSVDESGKLAEAVASASSGDASDMDSSSLSKIRGSMSTFASNFDKESYQAVYEFKADMESSILEMASDQLLSNLEEMQGTSSALVNLCTAPQEGIVVYSTDGDENLQAEEVTSSDFDQKDYQKTGLRLNKTVTSGQPLYKLLTDENWSLVIPLNKKMVTELADKSTVKFRFLKDDTTFTANFSVIQNGDSYFGKLDMKNSLVRYASDRFLDIELILNRKSGLKIPNSAIVKKSFYKIPKEFASYDEENPKEIGLLRESNDKKGNAVTKYITATVYDETEDAFFVDVSLFSEGDCVIKKDSVQKYTVSESESLEGVYNINKGYAVFREIKVIDENEEYCIVEEGATFGLSQYDHIVLDASTVQVEDIVY